MSTQFSFGKGLLRAAISLGFLGCLIVSGSLTSQAAKSDSSTVATQVLAKAAGAASGTFAFDVDSSDSVLANPLELGVDEGGFAFEDSVELLRINIEQDAFGIDHAEIGSKIASTAAEKTRPNISPPLLV